VYKIHRSYTVSSIVSCKLIGLGPNFSTGIGLGGSVAEWFACWIQAQKDPGSNRSRDAVG